MISVNDHTFSTVPADTFAAGLRLAYTGLQHISDVLPQAQQLQQGQQQGPTQQQQQQQQQQAVWWPRHVDTVWLSTGNTFLPCALRLLTVISANLPGTQGAAEVLRDMPHWLRPLLLLPDLLPACVAMVATTAVLFAAKQDIASSRGTSTSLDGSNCWPPQQWQLELSPAQLQLCDVLGVSGQTLLWAAGAISLQWDCPTIRRTVMHSVAIVYCSIVAYYTQNIEETPPAQLLQMVEIDLLLPSFVLPWLDSIPTSSPDWAMQCDLGSLFCSVGCTDTRGKLGCFAAESGPSALQGPVVDDAASHTLRQQPPSQELLVEVLPVVIRLCKASLHQLQQSPQSEAIEEQTGTTRSQGSAAASSLGDSRQSHGQRFTAPYNWVALLQGLMNACSSMVAQQAVPSSSIDSSHGRVVGRPVLALFDVFRQHAANLFTVLEGTVRHVAVLTPTNSSKASVVSAVASLCQREMEGLPAALPTLAREAGPGSRTQQQLYSLLCSLAKLSVPGADSASDVSLLRYTVAQAALLLLLAPTPDAIAALEVARAANKAMLRDMEPVVTTAAMEEAVGSVVAAAANATAAAGTVKAVDVLPSLAILGRCCLQWAQELEAEVPTLVQQSAEGHGEQLQRSFAQCHASTLCKKVGQLSRMEFYVVLVQQWLQAGSHSAELSAAGYATEAVLQQLKELLAAVRATQVTGSSGEKETPDAAAYVAVTKHLWSTGLALCALAVPCTCNYPGCTNMSGLTELGTVSGRSCMCGGCRVAHYCSRAHQKQHWQQYKPVCAALAAARLAVVSAAVPV